MGTEDDGWIRLGREVRRRRDALGLSQASAAEHAQARPVARKNRGLSDQTWAAIERGDRTKRRDYVLADLSWALGWTDDSAQRIVDGEAPVERRDVPSGNRADDELRHLAEKDERILQAIQDACRAILAMIDERRR
jgi:transcriptional regulator with XRE-family HTH domain